MRTGRGNAGRLGFLALAALLASGLAVAGPGCKDKKKKASKPSVVKAGPDYNSEWGSIRSLGAEGKFNCEHGLKDCQEKTSKEERQAAYEQMVKGYKQILDASNKADNLLEAARNQSPGRDFTGWEDEVAGWMELLKPVRNMLPNEYIDKLHD
ncbi:MAG: hypothetical protein MUC63_01355 [Planctomycetes bacterium]|jgi:hypothetical protein|nr:hypothetical protein [Planctomycetota bacterium]